ncbi:hypothetical protein IWW45_009370, partial [Coemansia sp. RSA 485]
LIICPSQTGFSCCRRLWQPSTTLFQNHSDILLLNCSTASMRSSYKPVLRFWNLILMLL